MGRGVAIRGDHPMTTVFDERERAAEALVRPRRGIALPGARPAQQDSRRLDVRASGTHRPRGGGLQAAPGRGRAAPSPGRSDTRRRSRRAVAGDLAAKGVVARGPAGLIARTVPRRPGPCASKRGADADVAYRRASIGAIRMSLSILNAPPSATSGTLIQLIPVEPHTGAPALGVELRHLSGRCRRLRGRGAAVLQQSRAAGKRGQSATSAARFTSRHFGWRGVSGTRRTG